MIIVTGGAGFIGSAFLWKLNQENFEDIIVVDKLGNDEKWKNLRNKKFIDLIGIDEFPGIFRVYLDVDGIDPRKALE